MDSIIGLEPGKTKLYDHATGEEGVYNEPNGHKFGWVEWDDNGLRRLTRSTIEGYARAYDDRHELAKLLEFRKEIEELTVHGWENAGDVLRQVRNATLKSLGKEVWE